MFQLIFDAQSNLIQCVRIFINLNFKIFYDLFLFIELFFTNIYIYLSLVIFRNITIQFYLFFFFIKIHVFYTIIFKF